MAERAHTVPVASPQRANAGVENQQQGEESKPNTAKRAQTTLVGTPAKKARRANVFFVGSSPHEPRGGARTEAPEKKAEAKKEAKEEAEEEPPVRAYPERPATPPLLPENSVKGTLFTGRDHGPAANRGTLEKLADSLKGGKFRWLNEKLYTSSSQEASAMFEEEPALFEEYHEGYREQVAKWPKNPLSVIASQVLKAANGLKRRKPDTQNPSPNRIICADLGCGDGTLAGMLKGKVEVHSFDLVSRAPHIVSCDIAKAVPLPSSSADFVVISLALMGTNWPNVIAEARRILAVGGVLKIAEVFSRLSSTLEAFLGFLSSSGFDVEAPDTANTHFVLVTAVKRRHGKGRPWRTHDAAALLTPCLYKKR